MVKNNRYHTRYANNTNNRTSIIPLAKELGFALFLLATVLIFSPKQASAASFNVVTGSSAINSDGNCQLEEAITNINDGTRTNADCIETGAYGTDDTINLPAGTITGPGSDIGTLFKSVKIIGQGKGVSIIDDGGIYLYGDGSDMLELHNFSMVGDGFSVQNNNSTIVDELDVDYGNTDEMSAIEGGSLIIRDSNFHNNLTGSGFPLVLVDVSGDNAILDVENTTFSHGGKGLQLHVGSGHELVASIKNSTFHNLSGNNESLYSSSRGIVAITDSNPSNKLTYTTVNNTFSNITNVGSGAELSSAITEYADSGTITHTAQNDLYAVGNGSTAVNYIRYAGSGSSAPTFTTTSNGGNISSDNSFSSYLTQSSDKHNQTSLASFLGVLTDNGGKVPTLALLEGSPAINAGTNVAGMTTDARGVARPQGGAFDAGAYEFSFSSSISTTAYVNNPNGSGTIALTGNPTISKRPTFSGTATAGSLVEVTVNSDPVICNATADSSGNWSCTLPSDLVPGTHSVTIRITKPDSSVETLGPYSVVVVEGQATTLSNTGQNTKAITGIGSLLVLATGALAIIKRVKRRKGFSANK